VDAPNAKGYAVYIDFLELIEEKIRYLSARSGGRFTVSTIGYPKAA
jgi:hypothetical protein